MEWTSEEETLLKVMHGEGKPINIIARAVNRTIGATQSRLYKLRHTGEIPKPRKRSANARKVRCIETGEEWDTVSETARHLGCSNYRLTSHIRFKDPMDGLNYEYADGK